MILPEVELLLGRSHIVNVAIPRILAGISAIERSIVVENVWIVARVLVHTKPTAHRIVESLPAPFLSVPMRTSFSWYFLERYVVPESIILLLIQKLFCN